MFNFFSQHKVLKRLDPLPNCGKTAVTKITTGCHDGKHVICHVTDNVIIVRNQPTGDVMKKLKYDGEVIDYFAVSLS